MVDGLCSTAGHVEQRALGHGRSALVERRKAAPRQCWVPCAQTQSGAASGFC